jgi:hypothetical protein
MSFELKFRCQLSNVMSCFIGRKVEWGESVDGKSNYIRKKRSVFYNHAIS